MKKLQTIHFRRLPLDVHLRYHELFNSLLSAAGEAVLAAVAALLPLYLAALAKEQRLLAWVRKSELTKRIAGADGALDAVLVSINSVVTIGRHSTMPAIKASGERVYHMIQELGYIQNKPYDRQVGDVNVLLRHFGDDYAQDVANLGMAMYVQQLQSALNTFESLLGQRSVEQIAKPDYTAIVVRKEIDGVYHQIEGVIDVNANVAGSTAAPFAAFIDRMNPDIERINAEFHRAKKDLSQPGCTLIEPLATQQYTGNPVTPLSVVHYTPPADDEEEDNDKKKNKPTVKLYLGKDYAVTYKNNIDVGMATLTVHGKGDYKGQVSVPFYIARQPLPTDNEQ